MKAETVRKLTNNRDLFLNIDGNLRNGDNHMIVNLFNTYFLKIADELIANSASYKNENWKKKNNLLNYLFPTFKHPFTNVKFTYTFTKEIEKIIQFWRPPSSNLTHRK